MQRLLGVAVQMVQVEVTDVTLRYVQARCRLQPWPALLAAAGCACLLLVGACAAAGLTS